MNAKIGEFGKRKIDDFFAAIGFGSLTPKNAAKPFLPEQENLEAEKAEIAREKRLEKAIRKVSRRSGQMVRVKGYSDILVKLSKCCNPIVGDDIVGFITIGRGITVHKKGCASFSAHNVNPERKVEVHWEDALEQQVFLVQFRIYTEERPGMVADISNAISDTRTAVQSLSARVNEDRGQGVFDITLQIHTLDHLNKVTRQIRQVKGVLSIERTN